MSDLTEERRREIQAEVRATKGDVERKARQLYETLTNHSWPDENAELAQLRADLADSKHVEAAALAEARAAQSQLDAAKAELAEEKRKVELFRGELAKTATSSDRALGELAADNNYLRAVLEGARQELATANEHIKMLEAKIVTLGQEAQK
ncbi:hypothetical protein C4565_03715 [Candidatus Parcubacteria bacterium]|nr:MAG: hypothetical protein C4565_03715 [Candidatus Parcubacteria bacterium]